MAKRIIGTTPKQDGYRMPAEFEPQQGVWMLWPERNDNWRDGGKPAQKTFADVAKAIAKFEKVTVGASVRQYQNARAKLPENIRVVELESDDAWVRDCGPTFLVNDKGGLRAVDWEFNAWGGLVDGLYFPWDKDDQIARAKLPENIRVVELESDDAWVRDCGPTFLVNDKGGLRAVDWEFNAWGGLVDGLYFPWDKDDQIARKICEIADVDSYRTEGFVLEGGSIHVDGEGTVLTTEMCLLSEGRNPDKSKEEIEQMICDYLGCEKVLWIKDGIDPDETNGHIDDVACFIAPGEVACIWTEDKNHPFYEQAQAAYKFLSETTDAKGRKLKVHKLCLTKKPCLLEGADTIDAVEGTIPREDGEVSIASYMNFLIVNGAVILPQYGDENDAVAIEQVQKMFPDREVVGVQTKEVAFGGGNIHCITQQQPAVKK